MKNHFSPEHLRCENLCLFRGGRAVLKDVSLDFPPGKLNVVLGPNGAGKSSLLRTALGLLPLDGGRVFLGGAELRKLRAKERAKRMAWVPQFFEAQEGMRVRQLLRFGLTPHLGFLAWPTPAQEKSIDLTLSRFSLSRLADREVHSLSGGELRQVLICRALLQSPQIMFLDEPTAFLDPPHQVQIMELLADLSREGMTVICVLHDLNLASAFADHVIMLKGGGVHAAGAPAELLRSEVLASLFDSPQAEAHSIEGQRFFSFWEKAGSPAAKQRDNLSQ